MESNTPRSTENAHVKMLLEATMGEVCARYNPPIEKAMANLASLRDTIDEMVTQSGGWQPDLLRSILLGRDYDGLERDTDAFSRELIEELDQALLVCLEKDIDQQVVFNALDEYVDQQFDDLEAQYEIDIRGEGDGD